MGAAVEFTGLSGGYNGTEVIKSISGAARRGRVTALIGPNGSGKSTLIRILCGSLPCSGALNLSGRPLRSYSRRELGRLVGVVPQHTRFAGEFAVCDIIGFGRLPRRRIFSAFTGADERAVYEAAEAVGVERLLFRNIQALSGGEAQRVAVAMVIAQDPDIFLLDEPSSSLDPSHSVRLFGLLRELAGQGKTVVASVHDVNMAAAYSDDYIAIKNGMAVASGSSAEIGADMLETVYDAKFHDYRSKEGRVLWHAYAG